jgi:hypothetical protein
MTPSMAIKRGMGWVKNSWVSFERAELTPYAHRLKG